MSATEGLRDLAVFVVEAMTSARMVDMLGGAIAERLTTGEMRPLLREVALELEAERHRMRKDGIAKTAVAHLREEGLTLDVVRGRLHVGPKAAVTDRHKRIIWALKEELIRELANGNE